MCAFFVFRVVWHKSPVTKKSKKFCTIVIKDDWCNITWWCEYIYFLIQALCFQFLYPALFILWKVKNIFCTYIHQKRPCMYEVNILVFTIISNLELSTTIIDLNQSQKLFVYTSTYTTYTRKNYMDMTRPRFFRQIISWNMPVTSTFFWMSSKKFRYLLNFYIFFHNL